MLVLAGLGNPGLGYAGHRHNIGFMAVDAIARRHGFPSWRRKFQGEMTEAELAGIRVLALKPMTYMNLSGQCVGEALRFYKLGPEALTVLYDELDLPLGRVKVKHGGGRGSHNGLRDIVDHIGSEFRRVRIGIGHPGEKHLVEHYVLQDFAKAERPLVEQLLDVVASEAPRLVAGDDAGFMNRVSLALNPPKPRPPKPPKAAAPAEPKLGDAPAVAVPPKPEGE
jgi:PTH1 family peptidyl-tRNA hydrolase